MNYFADDFQNLELKKSFRGYDRDVVKSVLGKIADDYRNMDSENQKLKDTIEELNDKLKQFGLVDSALKNALVVAQQAADEIKANADLRADDIIKDSEVTGRNIINDANERVLRISIQYENIKKDVTTFRDMIEGLFVSQVELLHKSVDESLAENINTEHEGD